VGRLTDFECARRAQMSQADFENDVNFVGLQDVCRRGADAADHRGYYKPRVGENLRKIFDELNVGDYVIVHVGYALSRLDPEEAAETLQLFTEYAALTAQAA